MIPQIIIICFMFGTIVLSAAKHGEDRGKYNIGWTLLSVLIEFILLWWGGFFECFNI